MLDTWLRKFLALHCSLLFLDTMQMLPLSSVHETFRASPPSHLQSYPTMTLSWPSWRSWPRTCQPSACSWIVTSRRANPHRSGRWSARSSTDWYSACTSSSFALVSPSFYWSGTSADTVPSKVVGWLHGQKQTQTQTSPGWSSRQRGGNRWKSAEIFITFGQTRSAPPRKFLLPE